MAAWWMIRNPSPSQLLDRPGKVHARVAVDFVEEFDCYPGASLARPAGP